MLDIKILLGKILNKLYVTNAIGIYNYSNNTAVANSNISATQTYYMPSSFTGGSYSHDLTQSKGLFTADGNGFKTTKRGVYKLSARTHINQASGACSYHITFYDWTSSTVLGTPYYGVNSQAYVSIDNSWVGTLEANHAIVARLYRYSTGTANAKWRPAYVTFTIELVELLE